MPICRRLFLHAADSADSFARLRPGRRGAAKIAMIAITTSSSTKVKPTIADVDRLRLALVEGAGARPLFGMIGFMVWAGLLGVVGSHCSSVWRGLRPASTSKRHAISP